MKKVELHQQKEKKVCLENKSSQSKQIVSNKTADAMSSSSNNPLTGLSFTLHPIRSS